MQSKAPPYTLSFTADHIYTGEVCEPIDSRNLCNKPIFRLQVCKRSKVQICHLPCCISFWHVLSWSRTLTVRSCEGEGNSPRESWMDNLGLHQLLAEEMGDLFKRLLPHRKGITQ
ncbi:hypothetical protein Mapa_013453 [Marchantia paleacea]|nr:hypothetical protein Mapa_013453 [Marchantia paleacea]